jgi:hypothetical protein
MGKGRKERALSAVAFFFGSLMSGGIFELGDRDEGGMEGLS